MDKITRAFKRVARENFLPEAVKSKRNMDMPLPIGHGQTNSQPYTVQLMLEWLGPEEGDKVLDVGSGSGWTSALLASIAGPEGRVYAVEKISDLVKAGAKNAAKLDIKNIEFHRAGRILGLPEHAPYDRILVSASAHSLPPALLNQLKENGKMVIPVNDSILEVTKTAADYDVVEHPGFAFVPLV